MSAIDGKLYEPMVAVILLVDGHGVSSSVCENSPLELPLVSQTWLKEALSEALEGVEVILRGCFNWE